MVRTRSGQGGSRSGSQASRGRPRNENCPPPTGNEGIGNPAPVTLEAIQKLLHDQQVEMNDLINERLKEFSKSLTQEAASGSVHPSNSPTHESHHNSRNSPSPPPQNPPGPL